MRLSAKWYGRLSERFGPKEARRDVVPLPHYTARYVVVGDGDLLILVHGLAGGCALLGRLVRVLARHFK